MLRNSAVEFSGPADIGSKAAFAGTSEDIDEDGADSWIVAGLWSREGRDSKPSAAYSISTMRHALPRGRNAIRIATAGPCEIRSELEPGGTVERSFSGAPDRFVPAFAGIPGLPSLRMAETASSNAAAALFN